MVGLIADHLWVRTRLDRSKERDDFHRSVEVPMRAELTRVADFAADISDWEMNRSGQNKESIASTGQRVSRKLNQTINLIAGAKLAKNAGWLDINTDGLDECLLGISETSKGLHVKTIRNEVDRLEQRILTKMRESQLK